MVKLVEMVENGIRAVTPAFLAGALLVGVPQRANEASYHLKFTPPTKKEISRSEREALANPQMVKEMKRIAYEVNLANEAYTERQNRLQSDGVYWLVTKVYNDLTQGEGLRFPGLNPEFFRADVFVESTDTPHAKSSAGARGYFQVTLAAAKEVNVTKERYDHLAYNPYDSMNMGMFYYWWIDGFLAENYKGWDKLEELDKQVLISRAYDWGPYNVINYPKTALAPPGSKLWTELSKKLHKNLQEAELYPGKILMAEREMFPLTFRERYTSDAWKEYIPKLQQKLLQGNYAGRRNL